MSTKSLKEDDVSPETLVAPHEDITTNNIPVVLPPGFDQFSFQKEDCDRKHDSKWPKCHSVFAK
jgi:hypothetical protein